jgi:hypothetical protein
VRGFDSSAIAPVQLCDACTAWKDFPSVSLRNYHNLSVRLRHIEIDAAFAPTRYRSRMFELLDFRQ